MNESVYTLSLANKFFDSFTFKALLFMDLGRYLVDGRLACVSFGFIGELIVATSLVDDAAVKKGRRLLLAF